MQKGLFHKKIEIVQSASDHATRDSNIELLRLIAMFMIVLHHITTWGVYPELYQSQSTLSFDASISQILNGFLFVGVNVFVLISGFYGIKLRWRSFFNLYFTCAFYGLCGYILDVIYAGRPLGLDIIYSTILIFSHCPWWFIAAYVGLMFLSPILNSAIEHMDKHQHLYMLGLLTIMNIWFGYFYHNELFSMHGYSVAHFVYIYWIGSYIHKYLSSSIINKYRWLFLFLYVGCALSWGIISVYSHTLHIPHWEVFSYNNPFIIIGAIGLFCFSISFRFQSRFINWLSQGALAVYLIHTLNYVNQQIYQYANLCSQWFSLILLSFFIVIVCIIVEHIRVYITTAIKQLVSHLRLRQ